MDIKQVNVYYKKNFSAGVTFGRELNPLENVMNRANIDEAKKALGLEHIVVVTHTPCLPTEKNEDNGIGVLASTEGTLKYFNFIYDNGIDGISIEPQGVIKGEYYCPYDSSSFSKKIVVNLKELTEDKWANILPQEVARNVVKNKNYNVRVPVGDPKLGNYENREFSRDKVIYDYALKAQMDALEIAYDNYLGKVKNKDPKALGLKAEFDSYSKENDFWLEGDSLYFVLSNMHGSDYYPGWGNELHRSLFDDNYETYSLETKKHEKTRLIKENKAEIDFYKFCQFVVNKQQLDLAEFALNIGNNRAKTDIDTINRALHNGEISSETARYLMNYVNGVKKSHKGIYIVGDKQIGFSTIDIWGHPTIFTKDEFMGAPPNPMKKRKAQAWNFKFIPKEKMFNSDGSLAEGGLFLKNLFKKTFKDNPGGVRIDHILGMIDPWTYTDDAEQGSRYFFKRLLNNELSELRDININEETIKGIPDPMGGILLDDSDNRKLLEQRGIWDFDKAKRIINSNMHAVKREYSQILNKIVLPAGEEALKERYQKMGVEISQQELDKNVKSLLICEDLGTFTLPLSWTMKELGLTGMRHARYSDPVKPSNRYRESNPEEQGNYWMLGGHDDAPYISQVENYNHETVKRDGLDISARDAHADYIARELEWGESSYLKDWSRPWQFIKTKFARIFAADKNPQTPNNILVNWQDLLGINVQYNTPGTTDKENNWTARIPNDSESFDKVYYDKTLPSGEGLSVTETLKTAMEGMGWPFREQYNLLIHSLSNLAEALKEKPKN